MLYSILLWLTLQNVHIIIFFSVHINSDQEYPGVKFFTESVHETIPSRNQPTVLDRRDIGLKLSIPEGAVQDEAKGAVELDVQPCFKGPFKVPPGCQLTSPVYMIRKQSKFKKDVKMEIEHFANVEGDEDSEEMIFVAANPSPGYHGSHPVYNLQEVDNSGRVSRFTPGEQVGVITFQELKAGLLGTARKSTNLNGEWTLLSRLLNHCSCPCQVVQVQFLFAPASHGSTQGRRKVFKSGEALCRRVCSN